MIINGKEEALKEPVTVNEYLTAKGYQIKRIAVEINGEILPKSQYETRQFCESDKVEIVTFMGGG